MDHVNLSENEWRKKLSPEQYHVLREAGTERAFAGKYDNNKADGLYRCAGCGNPLFDSEDKFDSGSGWPSFTQPVEPKAVTEHRDVSHGMTRVEVRCARVRRTSGTCVSRRATADRATLLHQFGQPEFRTAEVIEASRLASHFVKGRLFTPC